MICFPVSGQSGFSDISGFPQGNCWNPVESLGCYHNTADALCESSRRRGGVIRKYYHRFVLLVWIWRLWSAFAIQLNDLSCCQFANISMYILTYILMIIYTNDNTFRLHLTNEHYNLRCYLFTVSYLILYDTYSFCEFIYAYLNMRKLTRYVQFNNYWPPGFSKYWNHCLSCS